MRVPEASLRTFLEAPALAFAGARRSGKGFGSALLRELVRHGYRVWPVHPEISVWEDLPCAPALDQLPHPMPVVVALPRAKAKAFIEAGWEAGFRHFWVQQSSESPELLAWAEGRNLSLITGQCLFMHLPNPQGFHRFHRGLWKVLGLYQGAF